MTRIWIYILVAVLIISHPLYACFDYRPNGTITCSTSGVINVGESVTFTASNLDCSIVEYEWRLPSAAYCISGVNSDQVKCKFSPAGQYTVELLIKCVHNLWNVDPLDTNPETIGRITYTITVAPVSGPWYVSPGGNNNNNGLSNSATGAFRIIQTAIDSAIDGQEIIVESGDSAAPAVYYEQIDVKGKNLNIHSTNPDNWEAVQNTIIDANKQGTAVMFGGTETSLCQLKGFTIRGGFPTEEALALHLTFDSSQESGSDSSGKGRNGIFVGAQRTDSGRFGGGINFDGIDDYIRIENYKGVLGRRSRTVSVWIKPEGTGSPTICSWGSIEEGKRWMVTLDGIDGGLALGVWGGRKHSSINLRDGRWHHVAVTLDGDSNPNITEAKLYVDGIEDTNAVVDNCIGGREIFTEDGSEVIIGARFEDEVDPDADYCYTGKMDELKIFSRALTHSEIEKLALTPIELHLKLDGTAIDSSGNQYNGTVAGDQSWIGSGRILGALDLDGTGDYVALPSGIINPAETSFSVFLWVRQDEKTVNNPYIVQQANDSSDRQGRSWLFRNAVDDRLGTNIGNIVTYSGNPVFTNTGEWIHIGLTYNGQKVTLYVNGQSCGSALRTAEECSGSILIGRHKSENDSDYPNWNGAVDDLRIYKGVIGPDEIQRIFNHEEPVAHWTMDAISGNTISDSSSYNRSGTFNAPSPTSICSGDRIGNAIQLQNNEYIQIADWTGITGGNSRTCSGWIRTSQVNGQIFSWGEVATGKKWIVRVNSTGELRAEVQNGYIVGTKLLTDNKWHHIAVVLDNDGTPDISEVKLYVDGIRETISTVAACAIDTSATNNVQLGAYSPAPLYFNGWLDDLRIYSWPLSQEKIQQIANDMDLVAHWTLDELSGTTSADSSDNSITGTWNGGPVPSVEGFNNGAMEFDGTDDYITTSCVGILGTQDRTVSAWIKAVPQTYTAEAPVLRTIVGWGGTAIGGVWNLAVNYVLNEGPYGTIRLAANGSKVVGTTRIDDNHWHHVAAVFANDGTPKVSDIQLYIDGKKEVISYKIEASLNTGTGNNVNIGAMKYQSDDPMFYFKGKIDDVRIYDRALSEADLWQMYQASVGGGIAGHGTSASIEQCIIKNNHSSSNGGGVGSFNGKISRCYILDNKATANGGGLADCGGDIINSIIAQNTAQNGGGLDNCGTAILNCTITDNIAHNSVGGVRECDGSIINTILWDNNDSDNETNSQQCQINNCNATVSFSCVQDNLEDENIYTGRGNIDQDPLFKEDRYHLSSNSPCINNANEEALGNNSSLADIDGQGRFMNGILDIGADEVPLILFVNKFASGAIHDGSSWVKAYTNLQDALVFAGFGSQIWVAGGVYTPDVGGGNILHNRSASFELIEGVKLYGGFVGTETLLSERNWVINPTILSGDLNQDDYSGGSMTDNSYHVVKGADDAVLDGFRIVRGNANGSETNASGGGIYNDDASLILQNCVLIANHAVQYGGAIYNKDCVPSVVISSCDILYNSAVNAGGGMYNNASKSIVTNSIFWGNTPTGNGSIANINTSTVVFSYCDIQNSNGSGVNWNSNVGIDGGNNIAADPLFIDYDGIDNYPGTEDDNYLLAPLSPCHGRGVSGQAVGIGTQPKTQILNEAYIPDPIDINVLNDLVYVLSESTHAIYVYDDQLVLQTSYFDNGVLIVDALDPKGMCITEGGWVFVADTGNHRIIHYGSDGTYHGIYSLYNSNYEELDFTPYNIEWDSDSYRMYITDWGENCVLISSNSIITKHGGLGTDAGQFNLPSGLIFLKQMGILLIADKDNHRIQVIDKTSCEGIVQFGSQGTGANNLYSPSDVWYDSQCNLIFVADTSNNRIQILQMTDNEISNIKQIEDLGLSNPASIAYVNNGKQEICIADTGNNRIVKVQVDLDDHVSTPLFVWESFKNAVRAHDIPVALSYISQSSRNKYGEILLSLDLQLEEVVNGMGSMILEYKTNNACLFKMRHNKGEGIVAAYPVYFVKDIDGQWKIDCF